MKKELILFACMTAVPYLLNSAGQCADAIKGNPSKEPVCSKTRSNVSYNNSWLDVFDKYSDPVTYFPAGYEQSCESESAIARPIPRALPDRKLPVSISSIRANWILDTLASAYNEILVYRDKDNPGLKAILFTDHAGNMLLQLEQDGKSREIRVQKVEFHTPVNHKRAKNPLNKPMKNDLAVGKGAGYVPV